MSKPPVVDSGDEEKREDEDEEEPKRKRNKRTRPKIQDSLPDTDESELFLRIRLIPGTYELKSLVRRRRGIFTLLSKSSNGN